MNNIDVILYGAGLTWPNDRYTSAIADAMTSITWIYRAYASWPVDRQRDLDEKFESLEKEVGEENSDMIWGQAQRWVSRWHDDEEESYEEPEEDYSVVVEGMDAEELYHEGIKEANSAAEHYLSMAEVENIFEMIREALIETGNAYFLTLAGMNWPDSLYTEEIGLTAIKYASIDELYTIAVDWPDSRTTPDITKAFKEKIYAADDVTLLYNGGSSWKEAFWDTKMERLVIKNSNANMAWDLYLAGKHWPDSRFKKVFSQLMVKIGSAKELYYAGKDWPDSRYIPEIGQRLAYIDDERDYSSFKVKHRWPESRKKDVLNG